MVDAYRGTETYIFISYSHKDSREVHKIIERMSSDGYRIWFDDGIDPGTEWDETIAKHIKECEYFIAFISENYLESDNCKDELNYARDKSKKRILIYLENVVLPDGMAMRLNRLQYVSKYNYADEEKFYEKLYSSDGISEFKSAKHIKKTDPVRSAAFDETEEEDPLFFKAVLLTINTGKVSTSLLQRRLEIGYGRAAKIIDRMEELGYVSKADGNKPRTILITDLKKEIDPLMRKAVELAVDTTKISTSLLQRKLSIGFGRAVKLIDQMELLGYVSEANGAKPRRILLTKEELPSVLLSLPGDNDGEDEA